MTPQKFMERSISFVRPQSRRWAPEVAARFSFLRADEGKRETLKRWRLRQFQLVPLFVSGLVCAGSSLAALSVLVWAPGRAEKVTPELILSVRKAEQRRGGSGGASSPSCSSPPRHPRLLRASNCCLSTRSSAGPLCCTFDLFPSANGCKMGPEPNALIRKGNESGVGL